MERKNVRGRIRRMTAILLSALMLLTIAAPEAVMASSRSRRKRVVNPSVQYAVTQYGYGWTGYISDGHDAGRTNKPRRLEMVKIRLRNKPVSGSIQYSTRYTGGSWSGWVSEDRVGGKNGKRMEGIKVRLTGSMAQKYDVWYRVCTHNWKWTGWAKNVNAVGSEGYACYLTSLQVRLTRKGSRAPGSTSNTYRKKVSKAAVSKPKTVNPSVQYAVTQYGYGWTSFISDGHDAGRTNKPYRLEMVRIRLRNKPTSGSIQYSTRYTGGNWSGWVNEDKTGGQNGKRMEGIKVRLTGRMAQKYDVWYRVCTPNWKWTGWAKNGNAVGSEGYTCYLTSLQVRLTKKGSRAPGSTSNTYRKKTYPAPVNKAMRQSQGSKGRLVIPDLGISVTLRNASKGNAAYMQKLADWNDAAAWIDYNELTGDKNKYQILIADHAKQSFKRLSRAKAGKTMAYIVKGNSVTAYRCIRNASGKNVGNKIVDDRGRSVMQENIGGICTYTCIGSRGNKITLVEWKKA